MNDGENDFSDRDERIRRLQQLLKHATTMMRGWMCLEEQLEAGLAEEMAEEEL